jgi:MFS family permease
VIISVGAFAGLLDIVSQAVTPEILPDERPAFEATTAFEPLRNRSFVQYAVAIGLATFSMNLIGPFQSPYIVNPSTIGAPTTWLGIMSMLSQLLWVICAPFWGAVMDRWGRKPVVIAGTCLVLGWLGYLVVTPGNYFIVLPLVAVVSGFLSPAFWEGSYQMMLSLSSERNRVSYVAGTWRSSPSCRRPVPSRVGFSRTRWSRSASGGPLAFETSTWYSSSRFCSASAARS